MATYEGGRGLGIKGPPAPPKPRKAKHTDEPRPTTPTSGVAAPTPTFQDAYNWARQMGLSEGQATRLAESNPTAMYSGSIEPYVYAGYQTGVKPPVMPSNVQQEAQITSGGTETTGTTPGSSTNPAYVDTMLALLPLLDQKSMADLRGFLDVNYPESAPLIKPVANESELPTSDLRNWFYSSERARNARQAIDNMLTATGRTKESLGAGYDFLNSVLFSLEKYTNGPMSRQEYSDFSNEIDALVKAAEGDSVAKNYAAIGKYFAKPQFEGSVLTNLQQNKRLYT